MNWTWTYADYGYKYAEVIVRNKISIVTFEERVQVGVNITNFTFTWHHDPETNTPGVCAKASTCQRPDKVIR